MTVMVIQAEYATKPEMIPQGSSITGFFQRLGPMVGIAYVPLFCLSSGMRLTHTLSLSLS